MPIRSGPNDVWCADFKGWFRTRRRHASGPVDHHRCLQPVICCAARLWREPITNLRVRCLKQRFREFGLPAVIHTDNGVPFASVAPGGLSALSMWFVKLGIVPERSRPASPQDNGRHERMHRTLKQATAQPPRATPRLQQQGLSRVPARVQPAAAARGAGQPDAAGLLRGQSALLPAEGAGPGVRR